MLPPIYALNANCCLYSRKLSSVSHGQSRKLLCSSEAGHKLVSTLPMLQQSFHLHKDPASAPRLPGTKDQNQIFQKYWSIRKRQVLWFPQSRHCNFQGGVWWTYILFICPNVPFLVNQLIYSFPWEGLTKMNELISFSLQIFVCHKMGGKADY